MNIAGRIEDILSARPIGEQEGEALGSSREGRTLRGFRFGSGSMRVSLLGGAHADEPVGPRLLRHACSYFGSLSSRDELLSRYSWWIVPHINPDGEARNREWYADEDERYNFARYLKHVVRELPGDDIEFGFPRPGENDPSARPENAAVRRWWESAGGPFALHASLHGMSVAAGPWFLIEPAWADRVELLKERCREAVRELGYSLHDVERHGEKGFVRLGRGFCTRPDSARMREHFLALDDPATAGLFRPSSMETIRSLGGDPLTLVSEMPLFLLPGVGETLGPPDPVAEEWRAKIDAWRRDAAREDESDRVNEEAARDGLRAMPIRDQMRLQWTFVAAGIETAR